MRLSVALGVDMLAITPEQLWAASEPKVTVLRCIRACRQRPLGERMSASCGVRRHRSRVDSIGLGLQRDLQTDHKQRRALQHRCASMPCGLKSWSLGAVAQHFAHQHTAAGDPS